MARKLEKLSRTFHSGPLGRIRDSRSQETERPVELHQGVPAWAADGARIVGCFKAGFLVQSLSRRIKESTTLLLGWKPVSEWSLVYLPTED
jgi:hypothetical protein